MISTPQNMQDFLNFYHHRITGAWQGRRRWGMAAESLLTRVKRLNKQMRHAAVTECHKRTYVCVYVCMSRNLNILWTYIISISKCLLFIYLVIWGHIKDTFPRRNNQLYALTSISIPSMNRKWYKHLGSKILTPYSRRKNGSPRK